MYNPFSTNIYEAERYTNGDWFFKLFDSDLKTTKLRTEKERLDAVLCNPAVLKVFKLQCDMFSLAKINAVRNERVLQNDPLVNFLKKPNLYQTQRQYLWDYMFWNMLGTAYLYTNTKTLNNSTVSYFLDPSRFVWETELIQKLDKNILSRQSFNDLERETIQYYNLDGTYTTYTLKDIMPFFDLSNGVGNWYRGNSAIDALYKVIYNSDQSLDAKGINLEFSRKFMVTGQHKETDIYGAPMSGDEKDSIERNVRKNKPVHAVKTMADIKRFVDNIANLKLDESYREDYFTIGNMYGIPRDVLEVNVNGSTYENQEKARLMHVEYCLKPKGYDLVNGLERIFGYEQRNIDLVISWNHLSFMQFAEREKALTKKDQLANLQMAQSLGALTLEEVSNRAKEIMQYE